MREVFGQISKRGWKNVLGVLDSSETLDEVSLSGLRLHALKGNMRGFRSLTVRANWRVIFRFKDGLFHDLDLVDYH